MRKQLGSSFQGIRWFTKFEWSECFLSGLGSSVGWDLKEPNLKPEIHVPKHHFWYLCSISGVYTLPPPSCPWFLFHENKQNKYGQKKNEKRSLEICNWIADWFAYLPWCHDATSRWKKHLRSLLSLTPPLKENSTNRLGHDTKMLVVVVVVVVMVVVVVVTVPLKVSEGLKLNGPQRGRRQKFGIFTP